MISNVGFGMVLLLVATLLAAAERPQCLCPPRTAAPASAQLPGAALQRESGIQRGEYSAFLRAVWQWGC